MVLESEAFRNQLEHEDRAFIKEAQDSTLAPSSMWGHSEKTCIFEKAGSHQTPNLPVPPSILDFQPPDPWERNCCCL